MPEKIISVFLIAIVSIFVPQEKSRLDKFRVLTITAFISKSFLVLLHLWLLLTFHVFKTAKISQSAVKGVDGYSSKLDYSLLRFL